MLFHQYVNIIVVEKQVGRNMHKQLNRSNPSRHKMINKRASKIHSRFITVKENIRARSLELYLLAQIRNHCLVELFFLGEVVN